MVRPYGSVLEESVLAASPMELTNMLFEKLLSEIRSARACLRSGDAARRSASASKAAEIAVELASSLDNERGGELSRNLRQLYAYVIEQVNLGHAERRDDPFANAERVVVPLAEAWRQIADSEAAAVHAGPGLPGWCEAPVPAGSFSCSG